MAEPSGGGHSTFGFLSEKLGPFPVWVLLVAAGAALFWYESRNGGGLFSGLLGSAPAATDTTGTGTTTGAGTGMGTDADDDSGTGTSSAPVPGTGKPTPKPRSKGKPVTSTSPSTEYTVRKGDTLTSVSEKFGFGKNRAPIAHANRYVKGEVPGDKKVGETLGTGAGLKTGQRLTIPGKTTTATKVAGKASSQPHAGSHQRHNHENRRNPQAPAQDATTDTSTTPDQAGAAEIVDVIPHRPLGL